MARINLQAHTSAKEVDESAYILVHVKFMVDKEEGVANGI